MSHIEKNNINDFLFSSQIVKRLFLSIVIIHFFSISRAQDSTSYHKAIIWRGFKHNWTYNHRWKRLGDYVYTDYKTSEPFSVHTSATGTGKDDTHYISYFTSVSTNNAVFDEGTFHVEVNGKYNKLEEVTHTVTYPAPKWMKNQDAYVTLLNGFDITSLKPADKIHLLKISVEDAEYCEATGDIKFNINIALVMNCQSAECAHCNNDLQYAFDIHTLVIGYNTCYADAAENNVIRMYKWGTYAELNNEPIQKTIYGNQYPDFSIDSATIGIKSFGITLNRAHHLVEFDNYIRPDHYMNKNKNLSVSIGMLYKVWQEGMHGVKASPIQSLFSNKRKGWSVMEMNIEMIQFNNAHFEYGQASSSMSWPGGKKSVFDNESKKTYDINNAKFIDP